MRPPQIQSIAHSRVHEGFLITQAFGDLTRRVLCPHTARRSILSPPDAFPKIALIRRFYEIGRGPYKLSVFAARKRAGVCVPLL
jgi:hypothetical protein